jgi:nucleotide-binding universal stress UspA family protein
MNMDTIVVAVDGSRHSEKVVDYAISLAKAIPAKILLVNVPPDFTIPEGYKQYVKNEGVDPATYFEGVAEGILQSLSDRISRQKVPFETASGTGNVSKFVLDTAESRSASMIVVGLYGLHRVGKVRALGSNARRIIENSAIPVVSVP